MQLLMWWCCGKTLRWDLDNDLNTISMIFLIVIGKWRKIWNQFGHSKEVAEGIFLELPPSKACFYFWLPELMITGMGSSHLRVNYTPTCNFHRWPILESRYWDQQFPPSGSQLSFTPPCITSLQDSSLFRTTPLIMMALRFFIGVTLFPQCICLV